MDDDQRVPSARSSRRRRWEVKSKESFETTLAVEITAPKRTTREKEESKKRSDPSKNTPRKTTSDQDESQMQDKRTPQKFPVTCASPSRELSPTTKLDLAQNESPESLKSQRHEEEEPDLLSAKISALIDEANLKAKDQERKSKEKDRGFKSVEFLETKLDDDCSVSKTKEDSIPDDSNVQKLSLKPSAPPLSPEEKITPRKKRHRKKSESKLLMLGSGNDESFISLQLKEMSDDIVDINRENCDPIIAVPSLLFATPSTNATTTVNTIYKEKMNGFVAARSENNGVQRLSEELHDVTQTETRSSHAIFLQSGFRTFSVLCQGLLAGLTLAHSLLIFLLKMDPSQFSEHYPAILAQVFFALIMFLTFICFVAACDRCDLGGVGVLTGHGIKIPWTPGFYLSSLILSVIALRTEDVLTHLHLYVESTLSKNEVTNLVDWWRWLCVARSSLSVLAWLAVVPDPHTDALLDAIQEFQQI